MKLNNLILLPLVTVAFTGCISLDLSGEVETPKESKKVVKKVIAQRPLIVVNNVPKYDNIVEGYYFLKTKKNTIIKYDRIAKG